MLARVRCWWQGGHSPKLVKREGSGPARVRAFDTVCRDCGRTLHEGDPIRFDGVSGTTKVLLIILAVCLSWLLYMLVQIFAP